MAARFRAGIVGPEAGGLERGEMLLGDVDAEAGGFARADRAVDREQRARRLRGLVERNPGVGPDAVLGPLDGGDAHARVLAEGGGAGEVGHRRESGGVGDGRDPCEGGEPAAPLDVRLQHVDHAARGRPLEGEVGVPVLPGGERLRGQAAA